jgi:hypothetical protein
VDLAVNRGPVPGQPGDQVELPQRAAAVERAGVQPADLFGQLRVRAGARQGDLADVVLDVEVTVVDPVGLVQAERHIQQLAPEHGHQRQPLGHDLGEPGQSQRLGRGTGIEDAQPPDVAGGIGRLEGEERGIHAGELPHFRSSSWSSACA